MKTTDPAIERLLPLPLATFHILLSLAGGTRHGYAIIQEVEARTEGALRLSAGTLYRSIHRMVGQDLIEETTHVERGEAGDERRRYYRLTRFGERVARAEAARLAQLVSWARASGLEPGRA